MHDTPVTVRENDISVECAEAMHDAGVTAWDIETTGLHYDVDRICTVQVYVPGFGVEIVRMPSDGSIPPYLSAALRSPRVFKVFHYAPFDLGFMRHHWGVRARNVGCTKMTSKIVDPAREKHSLAPLVRDHLGVKLDKSVQTSDWSKPLTSEQIAYAGNDVLYLLDLLEVLMAKAVSLGVEDLVEDSFAHLPVRVETNRLGCGDIFAY